VGILVDLHRRYKCSDTQRLLHEPEPYSLMWPEDPVPKNIEAIRRVAQGTELRSLAARIIICATASGGPWRRDPSTMLSQPVEDGRASEEAKDRRHDRRTLRRRRPASRVSS